MSRSKLCYALPVALMATLIAAAYGGWATITVENLPEYIVAGNTTNLTFSIRQHGEDLMEGLQPRLEVRSEKDEKLIRAVKTNRKGYYTAGLNVPEAGQWDITIHSGFGRSKLELLPIAAVKPGARTASLTHEARGRHLFVAKGCVACHTHAAVSGASSVGPVGPELTERRYAAAYLEKFLANPAVKATAAGTPRMPNLHLKEAEIASLIAFINGGARQELSAR